jgi:predicted aldo/keto reductase-like oxidoreductase
LTIKSILNTDVHSFCASAFTCSKCPSNIQLSKNKKLLAYSVQLSAKTARAER